MRRERLRWLPFVLLAAFALAPPQPASADRIPSRADEASASRAADLAHVRNVLARDAVAKALAAHGLAPGEVDERLARLSDEDLRRLSGNLDQIQAAGDVPQYIWILLAAFLAVSILVMIF